MESVVKGEKIGRSECVEGLEAMCKAMHEPYQAEALP